MLLNGDFGNLKMVKGDANKMTVTFVVKSSNENDLDKNIKIVYFDGTFKEKILGGINYTILVFATLTKTGFLLPLGFKISFPQWKGN
jgi:hypothetical protein